MTSPLRRKRPTTRQSLTPRSSRGSEVGRGSRVEGRGPERRLRFGAALNSICNLQSYLTVVTTVAVLAAAVSLRADDIKLQWGNQPAQTKKQADTHSALRFVRPAVGSSSTAQKPAAVIKLTAYEEGAVRPASGPSADTSTRSVIVNRGDGAADDFRSAQLPSSDTFPKPSAAKNAIDEGLRSPFNDSDQTPKLEAPPMPEPNTTSPSTRNPMLPVPESTTEQSTGATAVHSTVESAGRAVPANSAQRPGGRSNSAGRKHRHRDARERRHEVQGVVRKELGESAVVHGRQGEAGHLRPRHGRSGLSVRMLDRRRQHARRPVLGANDVHVESIGAMPQTALFRRRAVGALRPFVFAVLSAVRIRGPLLHPPAGAAVLHGCRAAERMHLRPRPLSPRRLCALHVRPDSNQPARRPDRSGGCRRRGRNLSVGKADSLTTSAIASRLTGSQRRPWGKPDRRRRWLRVKRSRRRWLRVKR